MVNFKIYGVRENEVGRLVPDRFLFCKKALYKVIASDQHLSFNTFDRLRLRHTIKTNLITFQTVDPEIRLILIFCKRVWVNSPLYLAYDFLRKIFLMLYFIN